MPSLLATGVARFAGVAGVALRIHGLVGGGLGTTCEARIIATLGLREVGQLSA